MPTNTAARLVHEEPSLQYLSPSTPLFNDLDLDHIDWLDDQGFNLMPTATHQHEIGIDVPAHGEGTITATKPSVLQALSNLPAHPKKNAARGAMAKCVTIEDALVTLLTASNSARQSKLRTPTLVGLLKLLRVGGHEAQTYACMLLVNPRMDRSYKGTIPLYVMLAESLPTSLPDELGPYRTAIVTKARDALWKIKADFPGSAQGDLQSAIKTIEDRLHDYERQLLHHAQVPTEQLQRKADEMRVSSMESMKRRHESLVRSNAQTDDSSATKERRLDNALATGPVSTHLVPPLNRPTAGPLSHLQPIPQQIPPPQLQPISQQIPPSHQQPIMQSLQQVLTRTPSIHSLQVPSMPARQTIINHPLPPWGPAGYFKQMLAMQNSGKFLLTSQTINTIDALAACANRQQLVQAMSSISVDGFIEMLELTNTLNKEVAGEIALATTLYYMENGLRIPDFVIPHLAGALSLVKRLPDDVTFSFNLAMQAAQLPPALRDAMQSLFNDLMHQKRT